MKKVICKISWSGNNYCATNGDEINVCLVVTSKTLEELKQQFADTLRQQLEWMVEDGEAVPAWLVTGQYDITYEYEMSALLRNAEQFTTLSALSAVTGIKVQQLSHYANNTSRPRMEQKSRIIDGLRELSAKMLSVSELALV